MEKQPDCSTFKTLYSKPLILQTHFILNTIVVTDVTDVSAQIGVGEKISTTEYHDILRGNVV